MENHEQNSGRKREQAELKKKIESIEGLSIGPAQKAELVLVLLNFKPATQVDVYNWNDPPEKVEEIFKKTGLCFKEMNINEKDREKIIKKYAVSSDASLAENLQNLDPSKDHAGYGRAMGFPESAIRAFNGLEPLLEEENYPSMDGIIFNFKLSKNNWQAEYDLMRSWSEAIRENSPLIYNQLIPKK
jgi:hypothetical protein